MINWPLLGLCRFTLAFVVLCSHLGYWFGRGESHFSKLLALSPFTCVLAFMVISGYSIHHSYAKQPTKFYRRRFKRLAPVYYSCLLLSLLPYAAQAYGRPPTGNIDQWLPASTVIGNLVCLQGVFFYAIPSFGPAWTLGPEVLFYWCVPLFAIATSRVRWAIVLGSAALYCAAPSLGVSLEANQNTPWSPAQFLWAWLLGWQLYEADTDLFAAALGVIAIWFHLPDNGSGAAVTWTVMIGLICRNRELPLPTWLRSSATFAGDASYPLYLSHFPLLALMSCFWPTMPAALVVAACLLFSIALTVAEKGIRPDHS